MPLPLDIQHYSTHYEIFSALIQSKPLLTASKPQHYSSFEVHAFFCSYEERRPKNSRVRIFFNLQVIQSCVDRALYPVIFFEKYKIIASEERQGQKNTSLVKSFKIVFIFENSDQSPYCVMCRIPLG